MKTHTHTYTDTQPLPAKTHHPPSTAQIRFQSWLAVALDHTVIPSAVVANYSGALFGRCQCLVWTLPVPCLDRAGCLFEPCWCLVWTLPVPCLDLAGALFGPCRCLVWTFPGPCLDLASLCGSLPPLPSPISSRSKHRTILSQPAMNSGLLSLSLSPCMMYIYVSTPIYAHICTLLLICVCVVHL